MATVIGTCTSMEIIKFKDLDSMVEFQYPIVVKMGLKDMGYKSFSKALFKEVVAGDMLAEKFAEHVGLSRNSLRRIMKKFQFPLKPHGGYRWKRFTEVEARHIRSKYRGNYKALARKFECSPITIRKICRKEAPYNHD